MSCIEAAKIKVGRLNGPTVTVEEAEMAINVPLCGRVVGHLIGGQIVRCEPKKKPQRMGDAEALVATDGRV